MTDADIGGRSGAIDHVTVVIPARDEAGSIVASLDAIRTARQYLPTSVTTSCVVVADGCHDDTAAIARRWSAANAQPCVVVECSERSAGAARALGTSVAISDAARLGVHPTTLWLAHTDADTVVGVEWLVSQLDVADRGVDAVAGIVDLDGPVSAGLSRRFRAHYRVNADGTHSHVHGANIGMRASTYLDAGGWDARPTGEDHDLWHRLKAVGTCVSSTAIVVRTSARLVGRAPAGFADDVLALTLPEVVA